MKLKNIISNTQIVEITGNSDVEVSSISIDSRNVGNGALFVAQKGTQVDGHQFVPMAIEKGAVAVVVQEMPKVVDNGVTYVLVSDSDKALAEIASLFYGEPSKKLTLVGVTGTNGKTTVATLLWQLYQNMGHKTGLISTVSYFIDKTEYPSTHTTPDSIRINKMLCEMVNEGCEYCFMEISSHSVVQRRVWGLTFAGGIFTNITHDHLDYHKTMAAYIDAKKGFFDNLPSTAFAIYNGDDKNGSVMVQNCSARKISYSLRSVATHRAKIVESFLEGTLIQIDSREVCVLLVGRFNIYNILAIYSAALELGCDKEVLFTELSKLVHVAGRFECYTSSKGQTAIVDYAHTPDALENILQTVSEVKQPSQKVYCVVGCGGNRDKTKRPIMARAAIDGADFAIITSDNPRFEKPEDIIADMTVEIKDDASLQSRYTTIVDRAEAIKMAFLLSRNDEKPIIVVAGKGHEKYQDACGVKSHFDDVEQVKKYL
ncbi:MAG: UDP-N-acetylmuramoyl-L-alanyl-D-glutamate--2,6-diaminopimelate ligase [Rikenellaceae bacterium]